MPKTRSQPPQVLDLRPGDLVRVRSAEEIFSTLDSRGRLDSLPFMPEMLQFCGRTFRVSQRADKTCAGDGFVRRMPNAVHLQNVRCDGSAHGGCQAACLMHWKEAWLERVQNGRPPARRPAGPEEESFVATTLLPATRQAPDSNASAPVYRCQATEIPSASTPVRGRSPGQYVGDLRNWNWNFLKIVRGVAVEIFNLWQRISRERLPERLRIASGRSYPFITGALKKGETPAAKLDLRPGDVVRIKSKDEIIATLDESNKNRGLSFDDEMIKYCGRTARVHARVNRLIDEHTGKMVEIKSDCIILDGIFCTADYHRFCTRSIYTYWREIWLERVANAVPHDASALSGTCLDGEAAPCASRVN